jgi:hypothetical protein
MSANIEASIKTRLLAGARRNGEEFERTLTRFAAERFLYRLGVSKARARCVLKGASLLPVWLRDPYRATRDVDVLAYGPADDAAIRAIIEEICAVPFPEDGLSFDLSELSIESIRAEDEYAGKRARFTAFLGKARIRVQVDFGFGDALAVEPEEIEYPTIIETLPAPRLRAYPRDASISEKFEAMVKLDILNSRMKDFHDIWALSEAFVFNGAVLRKAVEACFMRRRTPMPAEAPRVLTSAFYQQPDLAARWSSYLRAGSVLAPPPAQFEIIGERVQTFLGPVWTSIVMGDAFDAQWSPGGPWR